MSDNKPKKFGEVFSRGNSSKRSTKSYHRNNDRYSKVDDNASVRSSTSHQNTNKYLQFLEQENTQYKRASSDLQKAHEDLKRECELLKTENENLRKLLDERDAEIFDMSQKLNELHNSKFKHSRFSSIRQNFQNIFQRRKTKEELVKKKILQSIPETEEEIQHIEVSNGYCTIYSTDEANFRTTLEKMEKDADFKNVPRVLVEAVKVLEAKFMNVIGLYRVSGNYAVVQDMRFHINSNNFEVLRTQKDAHTITGIIKLLFRELEEPMISLKHLDTHIDDSNFLALSQEYQIMQVQKLVGTLQPIHRDTLQFLMKHLNKVIQYQGNQNNAHSLSVVVGACIFYELLSDVDFHQNLAKCTVSNKCIEIMIEDYSAIFEQV
ncbi:rho GTPase-activating protein 15-like isoform X1 [Phlebotomus papatasi]|uniref:rho GTPase-activating protein 15-like isoform X1 n=1 Tax=Phlebotomus papatasi TaxID=29031 RepID=UPI00248460E6|nr:rho GTPase-activating protein 15-like isoform X1 [Phlebotomus papatasi]